MSTVWVLSHRSGEFVLRIARPAGDVHNEPAKLCYESVALASFANRGASSIRRNRAQAWASSTVWLMFRQAQHEREKASADYVSLNGPTNPARAPQMAGGAVSQVREEGSNSPPRTCSGGM